MNQPLLQALSATSYPGRGIVLGETPDGMHVAIAYFIMGRSDNSRNRVFVADGDGIRTQAFDESRMEDPSLIIYAPVRKLSPLVTVVTNGDLTYTVMEFLKEGKSFEDALRTREFEPDAPNFTPRISGVVCCDVERKAASYKLSILKSGDGDPAACRRFFFDYAPLAGQGHFIHTYQGDGNPLPSFMGEPTAVALPAADVDAFTAQVWEALDADNKVSLFTRYIDLVTGAEETRIVNKNV